MVAGSAKCVKILMLKSLEHIYHAFRNPLNDTFAWLGAGQAETIVFQYIWWSLLERLTAFLEWKLVELPSPKNQFASDIFINTDILLKKDHIGKHKIRDKRKTNNDGRKVENIWILSLNSTGRAKSDFTWHFWLMSQILRLLVWSINMS